MLSYSHPTGTVLNRFDPRAKLVLLIVLVTIMFCPVHIIHLAALSFLCIVVSLFFFGFRKGLHPLKSLVLLFLMIGILTAIFNREGSVLVSFYKGFIQITDQGLLKGSGIILRLSGISILCYIYFITTELNQFILTLRFFLIPFKAALILSTAIRYIPLFASAKNKIRDSRMLLGYSSSGIINSLSGLIIYAVKQIPVLAANLECRGVFRINRRSSFFVLPPLKKLALDTLFSLSIICLILLPVFLY